MLQLPTDAGMYEPAKEAFPIIVGQGGADDGGGDSPTASRYTLNIWLFARLRGDSRGRFAATARVHCRALSQIVDTLIFITVSFYGVRPIWT